MAITSKEFKEVLNNANYEEITEEDLTFALDNESLFDVHLKTNFDDFKITVLRKNSHKQNKVLSAVANLVVSKSSKKGAGHYIEGKRTGIVRDKTKSVFNFIWLNAKAGLIHLKK